MSQISNAVRTAVKTRLADPTTGFNFWLLQFASTAPYNLDSPYQIDFSDASTNFWTSNVTSDQLDESSPDEGTLLMLYTIRAAAQQGDGVQKFTMFSGEVQIGLDIELSWLSSAIPHDTESLADATEDALVKVFNSSAYYGQMSPSGSGIAYNGEFEMNRQALRTSGENYRQRLNCLLRFGVHTN